MKEKPTFDDAVVQYASGILLHLIILFGFKLSLHERSSIPLFPYIKLQTSMVINCLANRKKADPDRLQ